MRTFVNKVMSLHFNSLSRFVIGILPSSKQKVPFNFVAAVTICSDFGAQENEIWHCFHISPIYLPRSHRLSYTFIKRLFSSSSLSAIRVVSSAYLRLLIFLPTILILACASSSLAFHMIYSAYKLNKWGDNIQLWCTPFPIWNQSVVPCLVLTVASWSAYRLPRRQIRWSDILISSRIFHILLWPNQRLWHSQ